MKPENRVQGSGFGIHNFPLDIGYWLLDIELLPMPPTLNPEPRTLPPSPPL